MWLKETLYNAHCQHGPVPLYNNVHKTAVQFKETLYNAHCQHGPVPLYNSVHMTAMLFNGIKLLLADLACTTV